MRTDKRALWLLFVFALVMQARGAGWFAPSVPASLRVLLVYETAQAGAELAATINVLRNARAAELRHPFAALDIDATDQHGKPVIDPQWTEGMTLPAVVLVDDASGRRVAAQTVPASATADDILAVVRRHGG